jgi:hypothetical protein
MKKKLVLFPGSDEINPDQPFSKGNVNSKGNEFRLIKKYLSSLNYLEISDNFPKKTFSCLKLLEKTKGTIPDAIIINNESLSNQFILLDRTSDHFYFGFDQDEKMTSKGVFPSKKTSGTDISIVNDRFIVIVRTFETSNIIRNLLNSTLAEHY